MADKIIVMWGQSNMLAQAYVTNLSAAWAHLDSAHATVLLSSDSYWPADGVSAPTYTQGYTLLNKLTTAVGDFGPELSLGWNLGKTATDYRIIKSAQGSTTLYSDWAWDTGTTALLYDRSVARIATRLAESAGSYVAGFVWVQGVSDALNETQSLAYQANLIELIEKLRLLYGPDMPFVFSRLHSDCTGTWASNVQDAQDWVAANVANVSMVAVEDLNFVSNHYDADSIAELGDRLGDAMAAMVPGSATSDYLENAIINATLRASTFTSPSSIFLSLHSATLEDDATGAELTVANGYARQAVTFTAPSGGTSVTSSQVTFTADGADWSAAVSVGIWDASSGGNLLYKTAIDAKTVVDTSTLTLAAGSVSVSLR